MKYLLIFLSVCGCTVSATTTVGSGLAVVPRAATFSIEQESCAQVVDGSRFRCQPWASRRVVSDKCVLTSVDFWFPDAAPSMLHRVTWISVQNFGPETCACPGSGVFSGDPSEAIGWSYEHSLEQESWTEVSRKASVVLRDFRLKAVGFEVEIPNLPFRTIPAQNDSAICWEASQRLPADQGLEFSRHTN